ncbi:hypothetical protein HWV23_15490 [Natronomonas halophila]|uniref:hypothetical protein n=1 Tax=Natronomonas halophila TaxID=2747817 RepID=UPI0015B7520E|nr:hypothetical protein [Natronomonas halophila]QLD87066.1 hypothetical protein HWV23_15490 [Natronomonas halophila]
MSEFPREIDLQRTPDFLFETGSILSLVCSVLFIVALLSTAALTYFTSGFPTIGVLASATFGLLAFLGVGLLYWSSKLAEV